MVAWPAVVGHRQNVKVLSIIKVVHKLPARVAQGYAEVRPRFRGGWRSGSSVCARIGNGGTGFWGRSAHLYLIQNLDVSLALLPPPPPQAPEPHAEQSNQNEHQNRDQNLELLELRGSSCWLL
jgi:hypothetical protein